MTAIREDMVHYAVRSYLKSTGWTLIAGEYPDGSDDELWPLNVMDPRLARDRSPDHRRHSKNKLVPDLVAGSEHEITVIEMKPGFDKSDEVKLDLLLGERRADLHQALKELQRRGKVAFDLPVGYSLVPALGFHESSVFSPLPGWRYYLVGDDLAVSVVDGG